MSSDRKNFSCLLLVLNMLVFFLLISFSWNSCSARICVIILFTFLLLYSVLYQNKLLTNRLQVGEKRFLFPAIRAPLGSGGPGGAREDTGRTCLSGTFWRTLEKTGAPRFLSHMDIQFSDFSVIWISL